MDGRFEKELRDFLGVEYPEDGNEKAIQNKLKAIAPSYWDGVDPITSAIPPGRERKATYLLRAFKYGYDPVYGYNPEAAGMKRG